MILVNSTPILDDIQQPQVETMKVDTPAAAQVPQNEEVEIQQEVQPESTEEALEFNGTAQNLEAAVQPDESQTTISGQPVEDTIANASA
jgi:hypothetical protein